MRFELLFTLLDYKRIPAYFGSMLYAKKNGILGLRSKIYGMITMPECVTLHKLAEKLPLNSVVVEIGSYGGLSSAYILSGLKKKKTLLYSIDPFDNDIKRQEKSVKKYKNEDYRRAEFSSLIRKPSKDDVANLLKKLKFDNYNLIEGYSLEVVKKWKRKIDMIFIDGNHEYRAVKNDYKAWVKYLNKGGTIVFHDANNFNYDSVWNWGLEGPTKVVGKYICPPKWVNIGRVDSMVYATKNY